MTKTKPPSATRLMRFQKFIASAREHGVEDLAGETLRQALQKISEAPPTKGTPPLPKRTKYKS